MPMYAVSMTGDYVSTASTINLAGQEADAVHVELLETLDAVCQISKGLA
jgi:hypothetical protein